jgi:hypothetical protein
MVYWEVNSILDFVTIINLPTVNTYFSKKGYVWTAMSYKKWVWPSNTGFLVMNIQVERKTNKSSQVNISKLRILFIAIGVLQESIFSAYNFVLILYMLTEHIQETMSLCFLLCVDNIVLVGG